VLIERLDARRLFSVDVTLIDPIDVVGEQPPVLYGTVFFDKDQNGSTSDRLKEQDAGVPGVRVYLDVDDDGRRDKKEPATLSNAAGTYQLVGFDKAHLDAPIRCVAPAGFLTTTPMEQTGPASDFGLSQLRPTAGITTDVVLGPTLNEPQFNVPGDPPPPPVRMAGVRVYLDLDRDGRRDRREPQALTTGRGRVHFGNLTPGSYLLRISTPDAYSVDRPAIELRVADRQRRTQLFALGGTRDVLFRFYRDQNGNGRRDAGELPAENGGRLYIDSAAGIRVVADGVEGDRTAQSASLPRIAASVLYFSMSGFQGTARLSADATTLDLPLPA
jgi:hypothetical protein